MANPEREPDAPAPRPEPYRRVNLGDSLGVPARNDEEELFISDEPSTSKGDGDEDAEKAPLIDSRLLAQAVVFSSLTLAGSGLLAITMALQADVFYPLFAFGVALYVAWQKFF